MTISFNTSEMSSYSEDKAAYIMEAGDYVIRVGNSSRNTTPAAVLTWMKKQLQNSSRTTYQSTVMANIRVVLQVNMTTLQ